MIHFYHWRFCKYSFISLWKTFGPLESCIGMTTHSYNPNLVIKTVLGMSTSFMGIWWYAARESMVVKTLAPARESKHSHVFGIRFEYSLVCEFKCLKSIIVQTQPSGFLTKQIGELHGLTLFQLLKSGLSLLLYGLRGQPQRTPKGNSGTSIYLIKWSNQCHSHVLKSNLQNPKTSVWSAVVVSDSTLV